MAVSFGTSTTATGDASTTLTITKPTGLAEGDLMIGIIGSGADNTGNSSLSGWTVLQGIDDSTFWGAQPGNLTVLARIATASDVAASDFTFTLGAGNDESIGAIMRFTSDADGFNISTLITSNSGADASTTPTIGGVTPPGANTMLMGCFISDQLTDYSGWAVVTDNPTWTEQIDLDSDQTNDMTLGVAYASRTQSTATGNFSASAGNFEYLGAILAINDSTNVTVSPAVISMTASIQTPSVSGGATVSPSVISMNASVQAPTVTAATSKWNNTSKSDTAPTVANVSKSSAPTWANVSKSSAPTWTNVNKT